MLDFMHLLALAEAVEPNNWKGCPHTFQSYNVSSKTALSLQLKHLYVVAIALNMVATTATAHMEIFLILVKMYVKKDTVVLITLVTIS